MLDSIGCLFRLSTTPWVAPEASGQPEAVLQDNDTAPVLDLTKRNSTTIVATHYLPYAYLMLSSNSILPQSVIRHALPKAFSGANSCGFVQIL